MENLPKRSSLYGLGELLEQDMKAGGKCDAKCEAEINNTTEKEIDGWLPMLKTGFEPDFITPKYLLPAALAYFFI